MEVITIWLDRHSVYIPRCRPLEQDQYTCIHVKVSCVELEIAYAYVFPQKKKDVSLSNLYAMIERGMPSAGSFCMRQLYIHVA